MNENKHAKDESSKSSNPETDPLGLADLLKEVVMALVDKPEKVVITEVGEGTGSSKLTVGTDPSDIAKVLGRKGSTIKNLREIFSKVARVEGRQCTLEIDDPRRG